jgi:hypothetical protein
VRDDEFIPHRVGVEAGASRDSNITRTGTPEGDLVLAA